MSQTSDPRHHLDIRKRIHSKGETYPSTSRLKFVMDRLIYVAGFAVPLASVPQLLAILIHHSTQSLSVITWGGYCIGSIFWVLYGWVHKEKPIYIPNIFAALIDAAIVVMIFIYR